MRACAEDSHPAGHDHPAVHVDPVAAAFYREVAAADFEEPPADRVTVCKLAAILRVADALDRSHTQRIRDFEIKLSDTELVIDTRGSTDTTHERFGIETKAQMFEDVYGLRVVLV